MTAEEREAWLDHLCRSGDPPDLEEDEEHFEPLTAEELAEVRAAADEALAAGAAMTGRRGPGMAGSARGHGTFGTTTAARSTAPLVLSSPAVARRSPWPPDPMT
jgi:hypothetical protein